MRNSSTAKKLALALAVSSLLAWQASAIITYAYTTPTGLANGVTAVSSSGGNPNPGFNLGMQFTVNDPIKVTAMGVYDHGQNGIQGGNGVDVAIYRMVDSSLVSGTSLNFTGSPVGSFYNFGNLFQTIPGTILPAGSYMVVAFYSSSSDRFYPGGGASTFTGSPLISNVGSWTTGDDQTAIGFINTGVVGSLIYGAGTFQFEAVPEASEFALAGVGLLGLVYVGRCYKLRTKLA